MIPGNTRWDWPAGFVGEVLAVAGIMDMVSGLVHQASSLLAQASDLASSLLSALPL